MTKVFNKQLDRSSGTVVVLYQLHLINNINMAQVSRSTVFFFIALPETKFFIFM